MTSHHGELVAELLGLWTDPLAAREDPEAAFARVYADPVAVNGVSTPVADLVQRAAALQRAFASLRMEILDTVETPDRLVLAFLMRGRQVGPYTSPVGQVEATGHDVAVRTIDVLTVSSGRVSAIWVVADELGLLHQLGVRHMPGSRRSGVS